MLEIHIMSVEKADAIKANSELCMLFQGSKLFVDNDILVTPIVEEFPIKTVPDKKYWSFDLCIADDTIDKKVVISLAELNLFNVKKVWAFDVRSFVVEGRNV